MSTTTPNTPSRTHRNVLCIIVGHRWLRERRPDRTVLLTCRRCGHVDVVESDLDVRVFGGWGGYIGPFGG